MCNHVMVCHGDKGNHVNYSKEQEALIPKNNTKLATFYITRDGKYAIDSDYVDLNNLENLDVESLPKIQLK